MINKFNDIMYSTLHWTLPRYHGHINDIFEDIQTNKLEDDYEEELEIEQYERENGIK